MSSEKQTPSKGEQHDRERLSLGAVAGRAATIFFGLCLIACVVMLVRGAQAPKLHSSHALIQGLVQTKPLINHLRSTDVLEVVRASKPDERPQVRVLARRLNLRPTSRNDCIELRATASSPERAQTLMESWIETGRDLWPESVQETRPGLGPFLIVARPDAKAPGR